MPSSTSLKYTPAAAERAAAGYKDLADLVLNVTPSWVLIAREEAWRTPPQKSQDCDSSDVDLNHSSPLGTEGETKEDDSSKGGSDEPVAALTDTERTHLKYENIKREM